MKATRRNVLPLAAALALILIFGGARPTFSWLSAQSDLVVNTFSAGAISLRLDEAKVDGNGQASGTERVTQNNYRIAPGAVLDKDPTVTVLSGSEECYVFLYVQNTLPPEYFSLDFADAWIAAAQSGGTLYVYQEAVDAAAEDVTLPAIFTKVTVSDALDAQRIAELGELTLKVQAYAVQCAGIGYEDALSMAEAYFQTQFDLPEFTATGAETDFAPEHTPAPEPSEAPAEPEADEPTQAETAPQETVGPTPDAGSGTPAPAEGEQAQPNGDAAQPPAGTEQPPAGTGGDTPGEPSAPPQSEPTAPPSEADAAPSGEAGADAGEPAGDAAAQAEGYGEEAP